MSRVDRLLNADLVITEKLDGSNLAMTRNNVFARSHNGPASNVVRGLTVATGEGMISRTKTFPGSLPFEVTSHRMSRSVTRPIGRPCSTTTSPPIFFAAIRFAASRIVRSGSMTITLRVMTSRTKTIA